MKMTSYGMTNGTDKTRTARHPSWEPPTKPVEPRHVYHDMDEATHAACCLSGLDPAGATIYSRVTATNDEEYMITTKAVRVDGRPWDLIGDGWHECYTITRAKDRR